MYGKAVLGNIVPTRMLHHVFIPTKNLATGNFFIKRPHLRKTQIHNILPDNVRETKWIVYWELYPLLSWFSAFWSVICYIWKQCIGISHQAMNICKLTYPCINKNDQQHDDKKLCIIQKDDKRFVHHVKLRSNRLPVQVKFNSRKSKSSLGKVMLRNQWHIGVHEHHLMFKGSMKLNCNTLVHVFLCNGDVSVCIMTWVYPLG